MLYAHIRTSQIMQKRSLLTDINRAFCEHPASVGESYAAHCVTAGGFGWALLKASAACFVHAVLPFAFEKTGSAAITQLHAKMVSHRDRRHVNQ
jgi:hypothetical protein